MTEKRIIPCLDVKDGRVVKGVKFVNFRDVGDPAKIAAQYEKEGADEIAFLDITATSEARGTVIDMVAKVARQISVPFTVGGGIRTVEDISGILNEGCTKVSINSAAVKHPELISEAADMFGSRRIVLAVDAKRRENGGGWTVYINGGSVDTGMDAIEWIRQGVERGAGEVLLTSIDCDGAKAGYDNKLNKAATSAVNVPVTASGGAGCAQHFYDAITQGGVDAVLAASLFHFRELEIPDLKKYLSGMGIPVRGVKND